MKQAFLIYYDYKEKFDLLSDAELRQIINAVFDYECHKITPNFDGVLKMAWLFIKGNLDRDGGDYERKCEKNRNNGKKGGAPKGNKNATKKQSTEKVKTSETSETSERLENNPKQPKTSETSLIDTDTDTDITLSNESESAPAREEPLTPSHNEKAFGPYKNVWLTDDDYKNLQFTFPQNHIDATIERMSEYCATNQKEYPNPIPFLNRWIRENIEKETAVKPAAGKPKTQPYQDKQYSEEEKKALFAALDEEIK